MLKVLSKQELENAVILNELVLIMENFGVIETYDEDEEEESDEEEEERSSSKMEEGEEKKKNKFDLS